MYQSSNLIGRLKSFLRDENAGAVAIEYALVATLMSIALITTLTQIGTTLSNLIANVNTGFSK